MPIATFNLVVIRSPDIEMLSRFYSTLGFAFTKHAHGTGPEHYSAEVSGVVFEIYPQTDATGGTTATRLGFKLDSLENVLDRLVEQGAKVVSPAKASPWGKRAVITDPIGHKVELIESL